MKKLDDILVGFDLVDSWDDGTKMYDVKQMHHVIFDYFVVNGITVFPNGNIDANVDKNCDLLEDVQNEMDEFHVYELSEVA